MATDVTPTSLAQELLARTSELLDDFPADYSPDETPLPLEPTYTSEQRVAQDGLYDAVTERLNRLPSRLMPLFVELTATLVNIRDAFGGPIQLARMEVLPLALGSSDAVLRSLALAAIETQNESRETSLEFEIPLGGRPPRVEDLGSEGQMLILMSEIERRLRLQVTPFGHTMTALLGPNALLWLAASGAEGFPKLQPHEYSRAGLSLLDRISVQVAIEDELTELGNEYEPAAKAVVALCWAVAALAAVIDPAVFVSEGDCQVSSVRQDGITLSFGASAEIRPVFDVSSIRSVVETVREALDDDLILARDLMWIALAMARTRTLHSGLGEASVVPYEQYSAFLSHRGPDSKTALLQGLVDAGGAGGVFLDCITMPKGVINRRFVYQSLARARETLVVQSQRFDESDWCRKERWLAEQIAKLDSGSVRFVSIDDALAIAPGIAAGSTAPSVTAETLKHSIPRRIQRDQENWARRPNLKSLKDAGVDIDFFDASARILERSSEATPSEIARTALELVEKAIATPESSVEVQSVALQHCVALFSTGANARSMVDVRRAIDQMNTALLRLHDQDSVNHESFARHSKRYLCLLAAATAIELTRFSVTESNAIAIERTLPPDAVYNDQTILLDVRRPGPTRDLHVELALCLIDENIGSLGILQADGDFVHSSADYGRSLTVLPCVTLYAGMEQHLLRRRDAGTAELNA
ncbi:MAG: hypothetical protein QNJ14_09730 [Woeseiaceae bacterium]|nr:hypothetical protein [Woeseiaceae bacterium]